MEATCLRFKNRLDGALNLLLWKVRVTLLLEDSDLWDINKNIGTPPTEQQQLVSHNKREVKVG
jgi:hypothetical protein